MRTPINHWPPTLALLFSATFWGVVWYPLRLLEQHGLGGIWLTVVVYAAAFVIAAPFVRGFAGIRQHWPEYLLLMLAAGWANLAFILAMLEGSVMRVLLLFYLSPVWALLLAHWLLHEAITAKIALLMLVAMCGALLMLWNPQLSHPWPQSRADWLALSAGIAFALGNVMIRRLYDQPLLLKTAVAWVGCLLVAGAVLLAQQQQLPDISLSVLGAAVMLGIAGFMLSTFALQYGVTHMPVQRSAVILLFELVAGAVSSMWFAGEVLEYRDYAGGLMIIMAVYFVSVWNSDEESG
ncbi:MAG TPA: EamA/RhaT family transporter [Gammaproteobacteria bacterium]|nr:EamA/RhaT family transporter [Gammaproteobacteria bacterium]